ncbi:hypothetical protein JCM17823_02120 [Halorubrum gandharaense]
MSREGPGYLVNLATISLALMAGLVVVGVFYEAVLPTVGAAVAGGLGFVAGTLAAFGVLLGYYALFLADWAPLGSPARLAFVTVTVRLLIVGFIAAALLSPPDPTTQLRWIGIWAVISLLGAYVYVYLVRGGDPPESESAAE